MRSNRSPDPEGSQLIPDPPNKTQFDFIVAQRPKYTPNSGPPLAPISIRLSHKKKGIIVTSFEENHQPIYVVSWPDAPHLRMTAKPETLLDYVSPRTFEEFEYRQALAREGLVPVKGKGKGKGNGKGKGKGKGKSKASKDAQNSQNAPEARDGGEPKQKGEPGIKPGIKRKHALVEVDDENGPTVNTRTVVMMGPPSRVPRKSIEEPEVFTSPQRPTLTSPLKQRGLADMMDFVSEEEDELPTDLAIEAQLQSTMQPRPRSKLSNNVFQSLSPEPSSVSEGKNQVLTSAPRYTRSSSRQTRGSLSRSVSLSTGTNEAKRQRRSVPNDSVATTSSLEAGKIYEALEQKKSQSKTPLKKQSPFEHNSSIAKKKEDAAHTAQTTAAQDDPDGEEEELGEGEYEIEAIVDETQSRVGKKGQKFVTYYLIKWAGNWPLSWEPAENVDPDAIAYYEAKKNMGLIVVGRAGAALDAAIAAEELAQEKIKRNKKSKRGHGADSPGDQSDTERDKFTTSTASEYQKPTPGQVIDDDDLSDHDSEWGT